MALLAEIPFESLTELFRGAQYLVPFLVLLLCGMGLPLPEEVTLIGSGLLVYQGRAEFWPITTVCAVAILLGDTIPYTLGRRYGPSALKIRWVRKILHPERFAILEQRFSDHGNWAIFTCRFLPGIRIPGYFTAGTLGMKYGRFLLLDGLGVLISVPVSIYLGELFGGQIDRLHERIDNLNQILAFGIVGLILIMIVRARIRGRERQVRALQADAAAGGQEPQDPKGP